MTWNPKSNPFPGGHPILERYRHQVFLDCHTAGLRSLPTRKLQPGLLCGLVVLPAETSLQQKSCKKQVKGQHKQSTWHTMSQHSVHHIGQYAHWQHTQAFDTASVVLPLDWLRLSLARVVSPCAQVRYAWSCRFRGVRLKVRPHCWTSCEHVVLNLTPPFSQYVCCRPWSFLMEPLQNYRPANRQQ